MNICGMKTRPKTCDVHRMRHRWVSLFICISWAVLEPSSGAMARDMSSTLAPAVNGLDKMTRDICHSFKLKCTKSQGSRKPAHRNATAAPVRPEKAATKSPRRDTVVTKSASKPVPLPTPKPKMPAAQIASTGPAYSRLTVPIPRARPAPETVKAPVAKAVVAVPDTAPEKVNPPDKSQDKIASIAPPASTPAGTGDCERGLRNSKVQFEALAAPFGDAKCPVDDPVRIHAIETPSGVVSFPEGPVFSCRFARQFAMWVSDTGSAVVLAQTNKRLEKVATGPGYDCRHRNGDSSGKMSEHAAGDAVDITTMTLAGGTTIRMADAIDPTSPSYAVLRALRTTACGYFTTVLGPGANEAHKEHYHLDLGVHGKSGNYRICE